MLDDFFWSANCDGFAFNKPENGFFWGSIEGQEETVQQGSVYTMFATDASAIIMPDAYFGNFLKLLYQ